jgi:hypothetical protein
MMFELLLYHTRTDHTVPYGTGRLGRAVPGTSCQATIMQSLRDILPVALMPPHAHGTALITYQTVSYTCEVATLRACVPGVRTGYDRSPPGALSISLQIKYRRRVPSTIARLCIEPGISSCRACRRELDSNARPSSQSVRPIFVHARSKRNAMDRSMPLPAAKSSAVRPPSWLVSSSIHDR